MELWLDPNVTETKVTWRKDDGAFTKPFRLPTPLLRRRSQQLRQVLTDLNKYVLGNYELSEERDPGWLRYTAILNRLQACGRALYLAIFQGGDASARADTLLEAIQALKTGDELKVYCSDEEVTIPFGFVFDDGPPLACKAPSRSDFEGFWVNRFHLTMLLAGSGSDSEIASIEPESFRTLYALHRAEVEAAMEYLGDDRPKFHWLTSIEVREHYKWDAVQAACADIAETDSVVFVLAHSDGDWLSLSDDSSIESLGFSTMIQRGRPKNRTVLLILNCCMSATGGESRSLLSAVADRGFCGMVGTEAEILNAHALRCGIRLMWGICAEGKTLGEAFSSMQSAKDLFPLNLFYTCYAERCFRLARPIGQPLLD